MWYRELEEIGYAIRILYNDTVFDENGLCNFMKCCRSGTMKPLENSIFAAVEKYVGPGFIINVPIVLDVKMYRKPLFEITKLFTRFDYLYRYDIDDLIFPRIWSGSYLQYFPATQEVISAAKNVKVSMKNKNELETAIRLSIISEFDRILKIYDPYLERLELLKLRIQDIVEEPKQWESDVFFNLKVAIPSCHDYKFCKKVLRLCPSYRVVSDMMYGYQQLQDASGRSRRSYPFETSYLELVPLTENLLDLLKSDTVPEKEHFIRELDDAIRIFFGLDIVYTKSADKT